MNKPKVSILCSSYNSSRWISGYCRSLNDQSLDEFEIIFVDACSTDDSLDTFRAFKFREGIHREIVECERRIPIYAAWNIAIDKSRAAYCMNVNTDDRLYPGALQTMLDYAQVFPDTDVFYSRCHAVADPDHQQIVQLFDWPEFALESLWQGCLCGPFPFLKRASIIEAGLFNPAYTVCGDYEMWMRMAVKRYKFKKVPEILGSYYHNPTGISNGSRQDLLRENTEIRKLYATECNIESQAVMTQLHSQRNAMKEQVLVCVKSGKLDDAKKQCADLCRFAPDDGEAWMLLAYIHLQLKAHEQAIESCRRAVSLQPENVEAHNMLGYALHQLGKYDEAIASFRETLRLHPYYADAWNNLGISYAAVNNIAEAVACYREALRHLPQFADAQNNLGHALKSAGKIDEAINCYREALHLNPNHFLAHYNLGNALADQDKLEEAANSLRAAIRLQPSFVDAHFNLGNLLKKQGKLEDALACYRQVVSARPEHAETWFRMGVINWTLGRVDRSIYCYQQTLTYQPDHVQALSNLGGVLNSVAKYDEALEKFRRAISLFPEHPGAHYNMGNAYRAKGMINEAIESYQKALRIKPDFNEASYQLTILQGLPAPEKPPAEYVTSLFDEYAWKFDQHLVQKLEYRTPGLLNAVLRRTVSPQPRSLNILDLGCGTGLFGPLVQDLARSLIGVDLSSKMVEKAREKNVYDSLHVGDIIDYMQHSDEQFDLIVAADVFPYIGNLEAVFKSCIGVLKPDGLFVFSVEAISDDQPYLLRSSGRYAHSAEYISKVGTALRFSEISHEQAVLRKENGIPVNGYLYVLRYSG